MSTPLGFAGIGLMGLPMCTRLLEAGFSLRVWNRSADKCAPLQARGARVAPTLAELAEADVIMLCLADTTAVTQVAEGLIPHLRPGQRIVDFSSIEPAATRALASQVASLGAAWIDGPVSGGVVGAETGRLAIMAGGESEDVEAIRPLLEPLCQRLTHMGPSGAGQVTKICNQMIVANNALVIAEAMAVARAAGVDGTKIPEALKGGFADSIPLQLLAPRMANRSYEPVQWRVKTLLKDLDNAVKLARELNASTPMSGQGAQLMRLHGVHGFSEQDLSTLIELYLESAC